MLLNAKWLTYCTGEYKGIDDKYGNPSPYFRHTFSVKKPLKKATLSVSALGVFKAYVNGKEVSNDWLSPGWVDYTVQLPLIRYDITALLAEVNGIGIVLGDGWAVGHVGSNRTFKRTSFSDRIEMVAAIKLEYTDGTSEMIESDGNWKAAQGAIRRSDIYMGEYIDTRLDLGDFSAADYDDSTWDQAEETTFPFSRNLYLQEVEIPPVVVKHTFVPELIQQEGKQYLYDVSQNISGVLRCVFKGTRGTKIVIRHGEWLDNGKLYTENLRKAEAMDTFILSGTGDEVFRPLFTFHGFRFAEITVFGTAEIKEITAEVMYTDLESTGSFACSDPIVTKVYQNALWGQRDNFVNVPTDCPQRDERLGWTGDAQIFCKSAMYNMDCRVFFKKYLQDVRNAQLGNGVIPVVAPLPHVGFYDYCGFECAAGWAECIGEIPYDHYTMYGDKTIIRDNLPALKKLIDYYQMESPNFLRDTVKVYYGDWLNVDAVMDLGVISTLYYARAALTAAELCHVLNDFEEDRYRTLYENIKSAFRKAYLAEDGKILSDTQSCYLISYSFGIITAEEAKPQLIRKLREDKGHLTSGFLGTKFLLPTLCKLGMTEEAYRLMTSTEYPGWGYTVLQGATTIWERWNSYTVDKGIVSGMNSFNHYAFGACTEWMYEYCLGIHPDFENPGFRKVVFRPYLDRSGRITSAQGHHDTDFGTISVAWEKTEDSFRYVVTVPETIDYSFDFPDMTICSHEQSNETHTFYLK